MYDDLQDSTTFLTNTPQENKPALEDVMKKFPGALRIEPIAYARNGQVLSTYIAVHTGNAPYADYSRIWQYFDQCLRARGLRR